MSLIITIIIFSLILSYLYQTISDLRAKLSDLEDKFNQLTKGSSYKNLSVDHVSDVLMELAMQLIQKGQKVEAIKKIHAHTNMSLKESKDFIDALVIGMKKNNSGL